MSEFWDKQAKQLLVISAIVLLLFVGYKIAKYYADIIAVIGISVLVAYLLIGPVDLLTKIVRFRGIAVFLTFILIFGFLASLLIFVGPKVGKEFSEFSHQIPEILASIDRRTDKIEAYLSNNNIKVTIPSVAGGLSQKLSNFLSTDPVENIVGAARGTVHTLLYILVTIVISYYFLLEGHKIAIELNRYIPKKYHNHITNLIERLDKCLRGFYGGMVKLAGINALVMFSTYLLMKLPYALLLALWHFLCCIIPIVGGWFGLIPALMVVAFTDPYKIWIPLLVYEGFTRLIKDNLITPRIMGDAIGMHPVVILIAVLAGLKTAGLVGVLFALPLFGVINVTLKYLLEQYQENLS